MYIFFGLPGAGKTFSGKIAEKYFGYHLYEGDLDLTSEMRSAIANQTVIIDTMRDIFFQNLIESVKKLEKKYNKIVVTQTFIKEKYREQFHQAFSQAKFILIQADQATREERILKRKEYALDIQYARKMTDIFGTPLIAHENISNNTGEEAIKEQLRRLLI